MSKSKFGYMKCPDCGERAVVKINERETLSYACQECDGNGYCKKGEGRYATWLAKIERVKAAEPAPAAPPAKEKKPAAAPATPPAAAKPDLPWLRK